MIHGQIPAAGLPLLVSWLAVLPRRARGSHRPRARSSNIWRASKAGPPTSSRPSRTVTAKCCAAPPGKLYLQRPGKFRWDYAEPSEQLVLADGKEIWFYDKDLAQANVRDMDATLASTPAMLLSGGGLGGRAVRHHRAAGERGLRWFQLMPKHPDTDFQLVRIGFDKDGELRSMFLADKLNQITQLTFTHPIRNPELAPGSVHLLAAAGSRCDRARGK